MGNVHHYLCCRLKGGGMECKMSPLVSIVIPVYNTQKEYFDPCIRSVLQQTFLDFEVLLIDDGSGKECAEHLDAWAESDARIRLYHIPNAGVSHARNYGIDQAAGKYLLFVDSDDLINQAWLQWAVNKAEEVQADAVFGGIQGISKGQMIDLNQRISGEHLVIERHEMWKLQCGQLVRGLKNNDTRLEVTKHGAWGRLIRKNVIGTSRFLEGMYYGEDQVFNHSVICSMSKIVYNTDKIYYLLEDRPGSATNTYDPKRLEIIDAYLRQLKDCLIDNQDVRNAYYLRVLSMVDNHVDHAKKTQSNRNLNLLELRRCLQEAIHLPIFEEAIKSCNISAHKIDKSYVKLWMTKHRLITMLAVWEYIKNG